ncbi:hypothetical protein P755_gp136 [Mycobacterium phage Quink]|uniref:Uncharacterized protein n=17 Tax=Viruses TaxID=10239 RepID=Q857N8_9CAUD|nr:gp126 [Mycobacterium phage Cjw1]YP_002014443.1 hypothetical protein Porky_124 [Mycobacterium phage Porky]YP_008051600.1 hypothetical protein PBI_MURPHY_123 [Mycobacterium phage Murphy]YP_008051749.1 hypothetical protein PBI_DUMBO_126 [Mycobacterium phage Dumbo]YP_008052054.1 hypothetical protein PBI_PHRUX_120 [Mycobacterium phage Phrux]YP_008410137.1 hypothetical protein PBI_CONTAGION_121 [Mycobacterium phage Contagion]YP_008430638.1 hypothetical protein GOKU_124 [Mycobacterium phage Goku]
MKRRLARALASLAYRLGYTTGIKELEIIWSCGNPPYVKIDLQSGQRVIGWVCPTPDGPI